MCIIIEYVPIPYGLKSIKDGIISMKPFTKIASLLIAVAVAGTSVIATGCSLNKEWSFKSNGQELPIGVYIYALNSAYQTAESKAKELEDYDSTKDSWLDMEITDDDGNKEVARKWIKDTAQETCLTIFALDQQLEKEGATLDEITLQSAKEQAKNAWEVDLYGGMYSSYGYIMPMKDQLEKYGVSLDSYSIAADEMNAKYSKLFDVTYGEGGSKEVKDDELKKFFTDDYIDYKYISVNLSESSTDEEGNQTTTALSEEAAKKLTDQFDGFASDINGGKSFDDAIASYAEENSDTGTSSVEQKENLSAGDEIKAELDKLEPGKASTLKVGENETAVYYLIYKGDINETAKTYFDDPANSASVLSAMKQDEFKKYVKELAQAVNYEKNGIVDSYDPKMFFEPVEPPTTAAPTEVNTNVAEGLGLSSELELPVDE